MDRSMKVQKKRGTPQQNLIYFIHLFVCLFIYLFDVEAQNI